MLAALVPAPPVIAYPQTTASAGRAPAGIPGLSFSRTASAITLGGAGAAGMPPSVVARMADPTRSPAGGAMGADIPPLSVVPKVRFRLQADIYRGLFFGVP